MTQTTLHTAADRLLGDAGPLEELVADRRGRGVSWRKIAGELRDLTGIDVTHETLRSWFPEAVAQTTLHAAADRLLGDAGPLEELVADRRGRGVSWRKIAGELRDLTGIDVTHETLRSWFPEAVAS